MEALTKHVEAIIFSSDKPVRLKDIVETMNKADGRSKVDKKKVEAAIAEIEEKYNSPDYAFGLLHISDGYQFLTKTEYHKTVSSYLNVKSKRRLSSAAMESLAIIAYKQPVTKSVIEQIRGVNCDYTVQRLLEKELVEISGRSPGPGRPLLYSTSKMFMDHFALGSIKDLPQLKEIIPDDNVIGVPELEDDVPDAAGMEKVDEIAAEVNAYQEVKQTGEELELSEVEISDEVGNTVAVETETPEVVESVEMEAEAQPETEIISEKVD